MSATVSIEIPREIMHATRMTPAELKRELAVLLFEEGRLSFGLSQNNNCTGVGKASSHSRQRFSCSVNLLFWNGLGKARELADMSVWSFQQLLGSRGISVHYDVGEYEADLKTLQELDRS